MGGKATKGVGSGRYVHTSEQGRKVGESSNRGRQERLAAYQRSLDPDEEVVPGLRRHQVPAYIQAVQVVYLRWIKQERDAQFCAYKQRRHPGWSRKLWNLS